MMDEGIVVKDDPKLLAVELTAPAEIYLSDARKVAPEKLKTVSRHPIKVKGS